MLPCEPGMGVLPLAEKRGTDTSNKGVLVGGSGSKARPHSVIICISLHAALG